jgi:uncharacterized protein YutE (UPF0331/DUF86 family)
MMSAEILEQCNTVEECYEFMLAYAAQGHRSDQGSKSGAQIREFLQRAATAIAALAEGCSKVVKDERLEPAEKYNAFFAVLDRDARNSLAAIDLVLAQSTISSQLVDNLNASVHLRALLTDMFLMSDIVSSQLAPRLIR